jgi:hypothetical protein
MRWSMDGQHSGRSAFQNFSSSRVERWQQLENTFGLSIPDYRANAVPSGVIRSPLRTLAALFVRYGRKLFTPIDSNH